MSDCSLLVCEQQRWWAPALRRLLPAGATVVETRSWETCWRRLQTEPHRFLVLEAVPGNLPDVVRRLSGLRQLGGGVARAAVVMSQTLQPARWLLREAGATVTACDVLQLQDVVRAARAHQALAPAPVVPDDPAAAVWQRLPWAPRRSP